MPGLRQNITDKLTHELRIDPEFAALIPPLLPEEFAQLEQSILSEGCRDAIIVWGNIIVDGHNRYRICSAHNIPYRTEARDFKDRDAAMLWMLQNQLGRRNLNDFQRVEMVRKVEHAVKTQAKTRQLLGLVQNSTVKEKFPERDGAEKQARDELGAMAGVSGKTYEHAGKVLDNAPAPVVQATRNSQLSIHAAYQVTKLPQAQQTEIAERIQLGEAAQSVLSDVKSRNRTSPPTLQPNTADDVSAQSQSMQNEADYDASRIDIFTSRKRYNIIYAAPTWEGRQSVYELLKLPVARVADRNSALLLWVNASLMPNALKVIAQWGFSYRNILFVWSMRKQDYDRKSRVLEDKENVCIRERCHFCLMATTGFVRLSYDDIFQYVVHSIDEHHRIPEHFKNLTVHLLGNIPTLELFPDEEKPFRSQYNEEAVVWDMATYM